MTFEDLLRRLLREECKALFEELQAVRAQVQHLSTAKPESVERMLTVADVANRCQLSQPTVRELIRSGQLRATTFGRDYRVREADFNVFCRSRVAELHVVAAVSEDDEVNRILGNVLEKGSRKEK